MLLGSPSKSSGLPRGLLFCLYAGVVPFSSSSFVYFQQSVTWCAWNARSPISSSFLIEKFLPRAERAEKKHTREGENSSTKRKMKKRRTQGPKVGLGRGRHRFGCGPTSTIRNSAHSRNRKEERKAGTMICGAAPKRREIAVTKVRGGKKVK